MASCRAEGLVLQRHGDRDQAVVVFTRADVAWLAGDAGTEALADVARHPLAPDDRVRDVAALRRRHGDRTAVLLETVLLRRRAAAKLDGAHGWLFTDEALQQATAGAVARHRAARLAGRAVHDVTCSVGAELAALVAVTPVLLGSDTDAVRVAMARHNVPGVAVCVADALRPVSRDAVVLADPARRAGGRRRVDPRLAQPPLDALLAACAGRDLVVKCAPGIDVALLAELGFAGEVELVSLGGDVREACLWSPGLASPQVRRRATVLGDGTVEEVTDADPDDCPVAPAGRYLVDPDGAVVRAGLVRQWATRHGLWQLDPHIAYLSGDTVPDGVRAFTVLEQVRYSERRLREALARHDCGAVEILVRGVDVDPAVLRPRLRLTGGQSLSVVLTRLGAGAAATAHAWVCRATR